MGKVRGSRQDHDQLGVVIIVITLAFVIIFLLATMRPSTDIKIDPILLIDSGMPINEMVIEPGVRSADGTLLTDAVTTELDPQEEQFQRVMAQMMIEKIMNLCVTAPTLKGMDRLIDAEKLYIEITDMPQDLEVNFLVRSAEEARRALGGISVGNAIHPTIQINVQLMVKVLAEPDSEDLLLTALEDGYQSYAEWSLGRED